MTYSVTVEQVGTEELYQVSVQVLDDTGTILLAGETTVGTDNPAVAQEYGERVFLPDLRRNFKQIAALTFPWEEAAPDGSPQP